MSPFEYQQTVVKRAAPITEEVTKRAVKNYALLNQYLNELNIVAQRLDVLKKHIFYGKEIKPTEYILQEFEIDNLELLHALLGCATESAELIEHLGDKDPLKCSKEVGDIQWYVALAATALNRNLENIMIENDAKLEARYKGGFTEKKAQEHNSQ